MFAWADFFASFVEMASIFRADLLSVKDLAAGLQIRANNSTLERLAAVSPIVGAGNPAAFSIGMAV
jgi:hypothetical protein